MFPAFPKKGPMLPVPVPAALSVVSTKKTVAFQMQNILLCVQSVFVESALPWPRCPWFPGHSFIRSRGMAGVAGDAGVVTVPKVTVPGPQGAAAGARRGGIRLHYEKGMSRKTVDYNKGN
ncbi:unnamed protein product [Boreogadus saida]